MNEAQVRTLEQVRLVVAGTQALVLCHAWDDEGRYGWIESVLHRLVYRRLSRPDRGSVLAHLQHLSIDRSDFAATNARHPIRAST